MVSGCARATSASESRFRISTSRSLPRVVTIVALDAASEQFIKGLDRSQWPRAGFFTAAAFGTTPDATPGFSMSHWLNDLSGRTKDLIAEVVRSDLVVMIAAAGTDTQTAAIIGETCQLNGVMTTALLLGVCDADDQAAALTLAQLRPYSNMLVAASSADYVADMLTALRA